MSKVALIFFVVFSFRAKPQVIPEALILNKFINSTLGSDKFSGIPFKKKCESCVEESEDKVELARKCVRAICGPEKEVESYGEMIDRIRDKKLPNDKKAFAQQYEKLLKESFSLEVERKKLHAPFIDSFIKGKPEMKVPKLAKEFQFAAFLLMKPMMTAIRDLWDSKEDTPEANRILKVERVNGRVKVEVNRDNLKKKLKEEYQGNSQLINILLKASETEAFDYFVISSLGTPAPVVLTELENKDDWREALLLKVKSYNESIDWITSKFSAIAEEGDLEKFKKEYGSDVITEISKGVFPKNEQIRDALNFLYIFPTFKEIYSIPGFVEGANSFDLKNYLMRDFENKNYDYLSDIKLLDDPKLDYKSKLEKDLVECKTNMEFTINALPSKSELSNLEENIAGIKSKFKAKVFSKFSGVSSDTLNKEINKISFIPPVTREEYMDEVIKKLKESVEEGSKEVKRLKDPSYISENMEKVIFSAISDFPSDETSIVDYEIDSETMERTKKISGLSYNVHAETMDICRTHQPDSLNDSFWPFKVGSIYVSWNSIASKRFGNAVIAHELGHAISPVFKEVGLSKESRDKYRKIRSCLDSNHTPNTPLCKHDSSDHLYTEEDWADFVSSVVEEPKNNTGCFLLNQRELMVSSLTGEANSKTYSDLDVENSSEDDPHSSAFFRILQIQLFSEGKFPQECLGYMNKETKKLPLLNCNISED